jgi:hypothetical protein
MQIITKLPRVMPAMPAGDIPKKANRVFYKPYTNFVDYFVFSSQHADKILPTFLDTT